MATIVVSPVSADVSDLVFSYEVVQLKIFVADEDFAGVFDQLEVWRSKTGSGGPYTEVTAEGWEPARLPVGALPETDPEVGRYVALNGTQLLIRVSEQQDIPVSFSGVDPISYGDAAAQVTAQGAGRVRAYVAADGTFVLETITPGSGASLQVEESDAAALLGLVDYEPTYGKEPRLGLKRGTGEYLFTDLRGSVGFFYKIRLRSQAQATTSSFSQAFSARQTVGVASLARGYVQLVTLDGKPLSNHEVVVYNKFSSVLVDGRLVASQSKSVLTDDQGMAQFFLVRGSEVTVSIPGTDIVRDVRVPTDLSISSFHLLGAEYGSEVDVFKVQVPNLVYAERRSL